MDYSWIDMHCDSLLRAYRNGADSLWDGAGHQSLKKMAESGQMLQFFAVFFPPRPSEEKESGLPESRGPKTPAEDLAYFLKLREMLAEQLSAHADRAAPVLNAEEIRRNAAKGIASAMLTVEDGRIVDSDIHRIAWLREMGVRAIGLTWNHPNCLGFPNSRDPQENRRGLTPFGREAVLVMNRQGILVDVSHLSDGGFFEVAEISQKPFVASHSNARAVVDHPRNLSDEMLLRLADRGGVTGLNLVPEFLNDRDLPGTVEMLLAHARHIVRIAGEDSLGIGSDFDGFDGACEISSPSQMPLLFRAMEKEFTPRQIDKFTSGNVLRVLDSL